MTIPTLIDVDNPIPVEVLDDGFVRLVDHLGDDASVVRSARVSYGEETKGAAADEKLINFLMKHDHGTPFEHLSFTFHIRCPLFVARQWFRHRIGSFNEISGRYVKVDTDFWVPSEWRINDQKNKQASSEGGFTPTENAELHRIYHDALDTCQTAYTELLSQGVAREQARGILPLATYTEFYWSVNARSLFNFIRLRAAPNAQQEIRDYANVITDIVTPLAPWTFAAFRKHILQEP